MRRESTITYRPFIGGQLGKISKEDKQWLESLGIHLDKMIKKNGYKSPYQFWIEQARGQLSRANLNYILNGEVDLKITTLRKIATLLGVEPKDILNFKFKEII